MPSESISQSSEIKALFDKIAPKYDQLNNWLSLGQHRIWKQMAVNWCYPQPGQIAIDICCGSGDLALLLAKKVGKTGRAIGVDFSGEQLAIARQRFQDYFPTLSLDWIEGDALNLPCEDNYFDCATMGYGLRNVIDIPRCLQELHRVLKPGAKAAILDFNRPSQAYMQAFQQWYLENLVVPTAKNFGLTEEYAYIFPSLERFPTGEQQVELAKQAGFSKAVHYPIALGMMGVLAIEKEV
jgi:demethylmenaquinone methyltransferase/2-methoxy-6-polyprenyl-1,4-benzoquinol methylase